jgi:hypothetical protein
LVNQKNIYKFKQFKKMKKLVFTAIAVIAFSGVAMAETTEAKSEFKILAEQVEATPSDDACQQNAIDAYERYIALYRNNVDDVDLLNAMMSICQL